MRIDTLLRLKSHRLQYGMPIKSRRLRFGLLLARILPLVIMRIVSLTEDCHV